MTRVVYTIYWLLYQLLDGVGVREAVPLLGGIAKRATNDALSDGILSDMLTAFEDLIT